MALIRLSLYGRNSIETGSRMPIQTPQWTDFLICPVCENGFELKTRLPISLACGHTVCKTCLANLQRSVCPFDQVLASFYSGL